MNFGDYRPGSSDGTGSYDGQNGFVEPGSYEAFEPLIAQKESSRTTTTSGSGSAGSRFDDDSFDNSSSSSASASTSTTYVEKIDPATGLPIYVSAQNPDKFTYPTNSFYGYVQAAIESSSAKTLAQPTLLVQEGQEAEVVTGTSVITGVDRVDTSNGSTQFSYQRENAGLTLKVKVSKIDDNGFVSMDIAPEISVPQPAGRDQGVPIFNISGRSLSSGTIRLRDRQTLVLTGVIQDQDREVVTKWPILGDLPLIGQLFRGSGSSRSKNELVILVTPAIVDDESGGSYGYGYRPTTREARQLMRTY